MSAFCDTSFLCSSYYADVHSSSADCYLLARQEPVDLSTLVLLEFRQSLRLQCFQSGRDHRIGKPASAVQKMMAALQSDLSKGRYQLSAVDWPSVHAQAESLSAKHTEREGHRFADILHVATALTAGADEFLTFDSGQRELAEAEGLVVPL